MIHEVDESLRTLVLRDVVNGSGAELSFDAPTKEWAARRNTPTVDLYLYDIHEATERRGVGYERVRDGGGRVTAWQPPPRSFKLSYLVTAWTQRPEDEHRLLAAILGCFLRYDALPDEVLSGSLLGQPISVLVSIGVPPARDRNLSDVWSALGGELKPSLDLVVIAPFDTARVQAAGPPVLEEPRITTVTPDGEAEEALPKRRRRRRVADARTEPEQDETVLAGREDQPGRILRVKGSS